MEINNELVIEEVRFSKDDKFGNPYIDKMRVGNVTEFNESNNNVEILISTGHYIRFKLCDLLERISKRVVDDERY